MECARRGESCMQKFITLKPNSAKDAAAEAPAKPVPTTIISKRLLLAGFTNFWVFL